MAKLLVLAIASLWTTMGASYTIKYFDCINPVAITTYKQMTACKHQTNKVDIQPETYTILQKKSTQRLNRVPLCIIVVSIHTPISQNQHK